MVSICKLPLSFDVERLKNDLANVASLNWGFHFNKRIYKGEWSGIPLRAVKDSPIPMFADHMARDDYVDTEVLDRCPYFKEVIESLKLKVMSARLLKLTAGSVIEDHTDLDLCMVDGDARLHIPVVTDPEVEFQLDGKGYHMGEGEFWYANFSLPHGFVNRSKIDRVHIVMDCEVNDWLMDIASRGEEGVGHPVEKNVDAEVIKRLEKNIANLEARLSNAEHRISELERKQ